MDTIPAVLRAAASARPMAAAYVEDNVTTTFADLHERVRLVAASYIAMGLRPQQRVALWAPNSVDWVVAALAVSYAGGILVPLNSRYTAHEVSHILARTEAPLVVVADGFLGRAQIADLHRVGTRSRVLELVDLTSGAVLADTRIAEARADQVEPGDIADILFTSGTTGTPKGVMSAHRQTVGVARIWGEIGGVRPDDRYLVVNPFFHSFGYKVGIITGLITGATLHPMATFEPDSLMRTIQEEQITVLPGAPTIFSSLLAAPERSSYDLSSLRLAVTGAAVIPIVLVEQMRSELAIEQVVTAFGMTEAVVATMCRGDESAEVVAATCGRAVPGMETRIDDVTGALLLRGEHVMVGYLDDPAATAEAIDADGWLNTGDVGTLDADGNLTITDRIKDMYICGGFNVYPAEVEQTIARIDGITESAVIGIPDERLGEIGKAYVVRQGEQPTAEDVVAFCQERLANFKVPRTVEFVTALPRNLSGKVLKNELRHGAGHGL